MGEGLGVKVERSRGYGNDVKNPFTRRQRIESYSVVQTSVEVTEPSLTRKS